MAITTPRPLHHIGIGVYDIDAAITWYEEVLGYRCFTGPVEVSAGTDETGQMVNLFGAGFQRLKIAHLSTGGGAGIELFESINPPHRLRDDRVEYDRSGTFHFCVTDPDIEGLVHKIVSTGGQQISKIWGDRPSHPEFRMVYCRDPFGTLIEIHTHSYEIVQGWR